MLQNILLQAQCCSDQLHCCPNGYKCDVASSQCEQNGVKIPWQEKFAASQKFSVEVKYITCPDQSSTCPDDSTCCKLESGDYGCCPFKKVSLVFQS